MATVTDLGAEGFGAAVSVKLAAVPSVTPAPAVMVTSGLAGVGSLLVTSMVNVPAPSSIPPGTPTADGARAPVPKATVMGRSAVAGSARPMKVKVATRPPELNRTAELDPQAVRTTPAPLSALRNSMFQCVCGSPPDTVNGTVTCSPAPSARLRVIVKVVSPSSSDTDAAADASVTVTGTGGSSSSATATVADPGSPTV